MKISFKDMQFIIEALKYHLDYHYLDLELQDEEYIGNDCAYLEALIKSLENYRDLCVENSNN